jgi:hypothetical protein
MRIHTYSRGVILSATVVAALCVPPTLAQSTLPKYDLKTEANLKGIVEELKLPARGSQKQAAHLLLKNGTDIVDVYLCPESFLKDMGFSFSKGDEIALTGSKVKQETGGLILAREIVKGTDTLVLRDGKGGPVWNWH